MSDPARIISGVIQGSCIGPLSFLLYVNRLTSVFDNDVTCHLLADDVKLYTVIKTLTDCTSLQRGIDKVFDWSVAHQLPISVRTSSSAMAQRPPEALFAKACTKLDFGPLNRGIMANICDKFAV